MENPIDKYKGVSSSQIIEEKLRELGISQRELAAQIDEHFQTLNAVVKGRRGLTLELADKLDAAFGFEPGTIYVLQAYYDADEYHRRKESGMAIGIPRVRRILFLGYDFDRIDWAGQKEWVTERVMKNGSDKEKKEIQRFYSSIK